MSLVEAGLESMRGGRSGVKLHSGSDNGVHWGGRGGGVVLRFFTLVKTNQPSGENCNKDTPGALADEGLKVVGYGLLTKNAWNLVRNMTKQR